MSGEGYYEIQIAPADEDGISCNQFSKKDTSNLNGMLLINNPDPDPLGSDGNHNLVFSLTEDLRAEAVLAGLGAE